MERSDPRLVALTVEDGGSLAIIFGVWVLMIYEVDFGRFSSRCCYPSGIDDQWREEDIAGARST